MEFHGIGFTSLPHEFWISLATCCIMFAWDNIDKEEELAEPI
jgi:hypothetical protein